MRAGQTGFRVIFLQLILETTKSDKKSTKRKGYFLYASFPLAKYLEGNEQSEKEEAVV